MTDKRSHRVAIGTHNRTPWGRYQAAVSLAMMGMMANPDAPPKPEPEKPRPTTQRVKLVDDAGLRAINRSRAERARINAKRAADAEKAEAGKRQSPPPREF